MHSQAAEVVSTWTILDKFTETRKTPSNTHLEISNVGHNSGEVILDYGRCEGGVPIFVVNSAVSSESQQDVPFRVVYSETREGIDHDTGENLFILTQGIELLLIWIMVGDGPFFLFSNAMDTYRSNLHRADSGSHNQIIRARFIQASQRYQKITLARPNTTVVFSKIGFERVRPEIPVKADFRCSDPIIDRIWRDGVRTVDMCTVIAGETEPAWETTTEGARVFGGHWAPCRQGTRWSDKTVTFETKIEASGASWGVHMVSNGLIFCLDAENKTIDAHVGLSNNSGTFPSRAMGSWTLPQSVVLSGWVRIVTVCKGDKVTVAVQGQDVAALDSVAVQPLLGGALNTGSVAFGGPMDWIATYRDLVVTAADGNILYRNSFRAKDIERTHNDFQVGTNKLSCLIDGAKRDRACFGGDAFVTGRSIAYSTGDFETWRGSLQLLMSHQTQDGLLGNLCPIQAPEHETEDEPPTYAFYSLAYALMLVVSVKDYLFHSGDDSFVKKYFDKMQAQMCSAARFVNRSGLVEAPPNLSSKRKSPPVSTDSANDNSSDLVPDGWSNFRSIRRPQLSIFRCIECDGVDGSQ